MSSTRSLIEQLAHLDIHLSLLEGKLHIDAPKGSITPALQARLHAERDSIVEYLHATKADISSQDSHQHIALNTSQEEIYRYQLANPHSDAHNICLAVQIHERINTNHLHKAWQQLIFKYDILRSQCIATGERPQLKVSNIYKQRFFLESHAGHKNNDDLSITDSLLLEEINKPFDLHNDSLIRLRVVQFNSHHFIFFLSTHQMICDNHSVHLLMQELTELYVKSINKETPSLHLDSITQYADFTQQQKSRIHSPESQENIAFWNEHLQRENIKYPNLNNSTKQDAEVTSSNPFFFEIEPEITQLLQNFSDSNQSGLDSLLLSAFQSLLTHTSGEDRFHINYSSNVRAFKHRSIVGPLERQVTIPAQFLSNSTVNDTLNFNTIILKRLSQHPEALNHITSKLDKTKNDKSIAFKFTQRVESNDFIKQMPKTKHTVLSNQIRYNKEDFQLSIEVKNSDVLACCINYNPTLYSAQEIKALSLFFKNILLHIGTTIHIKDFSPSNQAANQSTPNEGRYIKKELGNINTSELFENQTQRTPSAIAVQQGNIKLSYRELNQQANSLAHFIKYHPLGKENRIGLLLEPSITYITAMLACNKLGIAYIPINPNSTQNEIDLLARNINLQLIISQPKFLAHIPEQIRTIDIESLAEKNIFESNKNKQYNFKLNTDAPLYYINDPKSSSSLIGISQQGFANLCDWYTHTLDLNTQDKVLLAHPIFSNIAQKNIFSPLLSGATLVLPKNENSNAEQLLLEIELHKINIADLTPRSLYSLIRSEENSNSLSHLRWLTVTGDHLHLSTIKKWLSNSGHQPEIMHTYENINYSGSYSYYFYNADEQRKVAPIGQPIQNTQLHILDETLQELPIGAQGELYIEGLGTSLGHNSDSVSNKNTFVEIDGSKKTLIKTNMLTSQDKKGKTIFISSNSKIPKIKRHLAHQLESYLFSLEDIEQAYVSTQTLNPSIVNNIAYIKPKNHVSFDINKIKTQLQKAFPKKDLPSQIFLVEKFGLNPEGLINEHTLQTNTETSETHLQTSTEKLLSVLWERLLKVNNVNRESHFFKLGGDSLLSQQLSQEINQQFNINIDGNLLFENPTLKEFSSVFDAHLSNSKHHDVNSFASTTNKPDVKGASSNFISLSKHQENLIDLEHRAPKLTTHQALLKIENVTSPSHIQTLIERLVTTHPILNSGFKPDENSIQILEKTPLCTTEDLSNNEHPLQLAQQLHLQERLLSSSQSLSKFKAYQINDKDIALSISIHSLICDSTSLRHIAHDLLELHHQPDKTLATIFSEDDYISLSNEQRLQNDNLENNERDLNYWLSELQNKDLQLKLPTSKDPEKQGRKNLSYVLDHKLTEKIKPYCAENNLTPFIFLLANYHLLLSLHCSQHETSVAIQASNNFDESNTIYQSSNTLIINTEPGLNPLAIDFFSSTKNTILEARKHRNTSFLSIINELNLEAKTNLPFCESVFSFSKNTTDKNSQAIISLTDTLESNAKLFLNIQEESGQFNISFEYNNDLYSHAFIATLAEHYSKFISETLRDDQQPVKTLNIVEQDVLFTLLNLEKSTYSSISRLTNMQRDIYIDTQVDDSQRWNYFGQTNIFHCDLDPELLERAIQTVVDLEPNLRTHIIESNTDYCDIAYRAVVKQHHQLTQLELIQSQHNGDTDSLAQHANTFIYKPYALGKEIPLRNMLVRHNENEWVWVCAMHHIALDGFGMHLYIKKVLDTYERMSQGIEVEAVPYPFEDYYEYHRYRSDTQKTIEYWRNSLEKATPLSGAKNLVDHTQTPEDIQKVYIFDETHSAEIRKYCFKNRSTPASYLKSLVAILLNSYFNQNQQGLIFNEVRVGRSRETIWTLGCCFTNQPFIVSNELLNADATFSDFFQFTGNYSQNIEPYAFISNSQQARLVENHDIQVAYNFYGAVSPVSLFGIDCTTIENIPRLENAIHIVGRMADKKLQVNLLYNTGTWNDLNFGERLEHLSQQILDGRDKIGELSLLLNSENVDTSVSLAAYEHRSISAWLNESASQHREKTAIIHRDQHYSYSQLHTASNQLANHLRQEGFSAGDKIAICLEPGFNLMTGILALIKANVCYIPIDPSYPKERITYILNDSGIDKLITDEHVAQNIEIDSNICIFLDDSELSFFHKAENFSSTAPEDNSKIDDLFYIIYTSGSTGNPKATGVKIRGEINLLQWYCKEFNFEDNDKNLVISAIGFDLTQKNLFAPLLTGGSIVFPDNVTYDPQSIKQVIHKQQVTALNCAPSAFYPLVETTVDFSQLSSLRLALFGGESIRMNLLIDWLNHSSTQAQIINMYGPTECTDIACYYRVDNPENYIDQDIPIGKPNDNVRLYVVDSEMHLLPAGIPGELVIGGEGVGAGYLNQLQLSQEKFINNPFAKGLVYRTGDMVKLDKQGQLSFLNRKDFQLKLRGLRIEPGEIEFALRKIPNINSTLVLVHNEQLVAYASTNNNTPIEDTWRNTLEDLLPLHLIPQHLIAVEKWPLTPNGKIDRSALPIPDIQDEYVAPTTLIESQLVDIWEDILDVKPIGIQDDFFTLGGHSLTAAKLASRLRDHFQIELQLRDLFNTSNIQELAIIIERKQKSGDFILPPIKPANREELLKLSYSQEQLWLVEQLHLGISAYNMPVALRIKGGFNIDALESALQNICQRHEITRTQFLMDDKGNPYQYISENITSPIVQFFDVPNLSAEQQLTHAKKEAQKEINTSFDLSKDPLIRVQLIQYEENNFLLLMTMHHIISDGWSVNIILNELFEGYQAHLENRTPNLPPLAIQYADYSMWQRNWLHSSAQRHVDYWVNQLQDAPPVLKLPTDYPRPKEQTFNGALQRFSIGSQLHADLKTFSNASEATLFMTLIAGYSILLSRHANKKDIVIGSPNAGRSHSETESLIGFFVNPLILRFDTHNCTANDFLQKTKNIVLDALAHQHVPAELIIEKLKISRDPSYPPIAQVGFALQNLMSSDVEKLSELGDLDISLLNPDTCIAKYDLTLFFFEENGELRGAFEYNTDLFTSETINHFSEQLINIYKSLSKAEDQFHIDQINLSTSEQLLSVLDLKPEEFETCYPLPPTMQDLYLNALVNPETLSNNIGVSFFYKNENFDLAKHQSRLDNAIQNFSVLRGKIIPGNKITSETAYFAIRKEVTSTIKFRDVSSENWSNEQANEYAISQYKRPYDLFNGELYQVEVLKIKEASYFFILSANHIVLDGASSALLIRYTTDDIFRLSNSDNFHDFIQYSQSKSDQPETVDYWQHHLQDTQKIDRNNTTDEGLTNSHTTFDSGLSKKIKTYCFKQRITPHVFFKTIYGLLIAHYYRCEKDFVMRDTLTGRTPEFRETIACTVESPPFIFPQNYLLGDTSTSTEDLFKKILQITEESKPYRNISLTKQASLIDTSGLQFTFNILQYISAVTNDLIEDFNALTPPEIENNVQLMIAIKDTIDIELRYNKKDFQEHKFLDRLKSLCLQILEANTPINQLNFLLDDETQRLDKLSHITLAEAPRSLISTFENHAITYANKAALTLDQSSLSYQQLNHQSNQLAHYLSDKGINAGDRVAIYIDRSFEMIISILALLKLNAAYIPLDPHSPSDRVNFILEDSQTEVLISKSTLLETTDINKPNTCVELDTQAQEIQNCSSINLESPQIADESICYIIYTSGTTGKPKGCQVSNLNAARLFTSTQSLFNFNNEDVWSLYHSFAFDVSVFEIWGAFYFAGKLVIVPQETARAPDLFYKLLQDNKVTVLSQTPSAFTQLIDEDAQRTNTALDLRYIIFAGEALKISALNRWVTKHPLDQTALINMYGITETTVHSSFHRVTPDDLKQNSSIIGHALPDLTLQLVDQHRRPVAPGFHGEILVKGQGVTHGYLNRPELTAQRFFMHQNARCYASGDLAKLNEQNQLEYLGRIDQQVKIRGHRIELGEIEAKLTRLENVSEALVIAKDDAHGDKQLIAYILSAEPLNSGQLRAELSEQLPEYMIPAFFIQVEAWPQTANGKIKLDALPQAELDNRQYVAPRNKLEIQLTEIWQDVMGQNQIGVFDNFFELGGHSLMAVRLARRIQDELKIDLPVAALFNAQDISSLANVLSGNVVAHDCLVPLKSGKEEPIFLVHPINGLAIGFKTLAQHMKTTRPVIGIQAFGFDEHSEPARSVEEAASRYIESMLKLQPNGPYFIAGYSLGGVIALEIARQLIQQGHSISWFTVIDAEASFRWFSRRIKPNKLLYDFFKLMSPSSELKYSEFDKISKEEKLKFLAEQSDNTLSPELLQRTLSVLEGFKEMMDNYHPKPLDISCLYISAEARMKSSLMRTLQWTGIRQGTLGWEKLIKRRLKHISSPGDHDSLMQEPHVQQLASLIDYSIEKRHELDV